MVDFVQVHHVRDNKGVLIPSTEVDTVHRHSD